MCVYQRLSSTVASLEGQVMVLSKGKAEAQRAADTHKRHAEEVTTELKK